MFFNPFKSKQDIALFSFKLYKKTFYQLEICNTDRKNEIDVRIQILDNVSKSIGFNSFQKLLESDISFYNKNNKLTDFKYFCFSIDLFQNMKNISENIDFLTIKEYTKAYKKNFSYKNITFSNYFLDNDKASEMTEFLLFLFSYNDNIKQIMYDSKIIDFILEICKFELWKLINDNEAIELDHFLKYTDINYLSKEISSLKNKKYPGMEELKIYINHILPYLNNKKIENKKEPYELTTDQYHFLINEFNKLSLLA